MTTIEISEKSEGYLRILKEYHNAKFSGKAELSESDIVEALIQKEIDRLRGRLR